MSKRLVIEKELRPYFEIVEGKEDDVEIPDALVAKYLAAKEVFEKMSNKIEEITDGWLPETNEPTHEADCPCRMCKFLNGYIDFKNEQ